MATSYLTPNMSLVVPVVGQELAPTWASDLNVSLGILDTHNHSAGSGVQITPDGININADLPFNIHNATLLRSVRMSIQSASIPSVSPDVACAYSVGGELYWNDNAGNIVPITSAGNVNAGAGSITNLPFAGAVTFNSGTAAYVFEATSAPTFANMDFGTIILRYPGSYPTPSGNFIMIQAPSSLASGFAYTLPSALPAANNTFLTVGTTGTVANSIVVDNSTLEISTNALQVKDLGITNAKIANSTITGAKIVANVALAGNPAIAGQTPTSNGKNLIVNNTNNGAGFGLSIIRGTVNAGGSASGEGFTVPSSGGGSYSVAFNEPFADLPSVTVSIAGISYSINVNSISTSGFVATTYNASQIAATQNFCFIAVGARSS